MAKANSTPVVSNSAIVAALLAGRSAKRGSLTERVGDAAVRAGTAATRFAGQLSVAVDVENFYDGQKKQQLNAINERSKFWQDVADTHGLSPEEVAAIISA